MGHLAIFSCGIGDTRPDVHQFVFSFLNESVPRLTVYQTFIYTSDWLRTMSKDYALINAEVERCWIKSRWLGVKPHFHWMRLKRIESGAFHQGWTNKTTKHMPPHPMMSAKTEKIKVLFFSYGLPHHHHRHRANSRIWCIPKNNRHHTSARGCVAKIM